MVDAETSEQHEKLSDGQRSMDLGILEENVAGDLADLADGRAAAAGGERGRDRCADPPALNERLWNEINPPAPHSPPARAT